MMISDRSEADQCGNCRDEADICKELVSRNLCACAGPLAVHMDRSIKIIIHLHSNVGQPLGRRIFNIHVPSSNTS